MITNGAKALHLTAIPLRFIAAGELCYMFMLEYDKISRILLKE